jgi:hypothetical protein
MDGVIVKTWHGVDAPTSMAYMLPDNSILRPSADPGGDFGAGGAGGRIQRISGDDLVMWDFFLSVDHQQHHDIQPMPGGTVLIIAWERKSRAEAEAMGRQGLSHDMWPTLIVEVEPVGFDSGTVVREWQARSSRRLCSSASHCSAPEVKELPRSAKPKQHTATQ